MIYACRILSLIVLIRALSLMGGEIDAGLTGDLRSAQDTDPVSFDVRQAQTEILLRLGRLEEAVLVSRSARDLFPGSAEAQAAHATALVMKVTHEGGDTGDARAAAEKALAMDPASIRNMERLMFLCAARRQNLQDFRALGLRRATLNRGAALDMTCRLCGRHWLHHNNNLPGDSVNPRRNGGRD